MNSEIKTYISACYNIEICKSGDNGQTESRFPLGTGMHKNMILDSFLETIPYILATGGARLGEGRLYMPQITNGYMQIGTGSGALDYSQRQLSGFVKETNFIRPYLTGCYYFDDTGIGMRTYSKTYEFPSEMSSVTYREAGFRSDLSSSWGTNVASGLRNPTLTRFLISGGTGVTLGIGEYLKIKYDISVKVPSLINTVAVTGDIAYGDFNGSGLIKLVGPIEKIFGNINSDGYWYGTTAYGTTGLPSVNLTNPSRSAPYKEGIMWSLNNIPARTNDVFDSTKAHFSANYVPPNIAIPSYNTLAQIPRIELQDLTSSRKNPLGYYGTAIEKYTLQNKYIDTDFYFVANYPPIDFNFGGIFFTTTESDQTINVGVTDLVPQSGWGWYWKFDNTQTKYKDQLLKVSLRFSVDRG